MHRAIASFVAVLLLLATPGGAAEDPRFPKPPGLRDRVGFWKRIYTAVDSGAGLLHDAEDLSVVYETMSVPKGLSRRARERRTRLRKAHYRKLLRRLARGRRRGLSAEERRVLALFPRDVSNRTLERASNRVRFQLGQADQFRAGLIRMGRWEGYIRRVFAERGLPTQLVALPHVESSFNPNARSHVGASGIWQFTRSTGRRYLRVDSVVDERNDPFLSTVAAARLLKANYQRTGTWPLAITAYNHGATGIDRAVRKVGSRAIDAIINRYKSRTFGFASRNFYSEFMAALEVERDPERWFGDLRKDPPENPEIVLLDHYYRPSTLASAFRVTPEALRRLNPALGSPVWRGQKYVPRGYALRIPRDPLRAAPRVILASIPQSERLARQTPDRSYRVRRGDTLSRIARRFGVSQSRIAAMNGIHNRHRIRAGQRLKIPLHRRRPAVAASYVPEPVPADGLYRVRRGDSLWSLARRFGVSQQDLAELNRLASPHQLRAGQVIQIPGGAATAKAGKVRTGVYIVRRGDTVDGIARRFGVSSRRIVSLNGIRNRHRIRPGQRLYLPAAEREPTASAQ